MLATASYTSLTDTQMDVTGTTGGMNNIILALILLRTFDRYSDGCYWNNWRYEQYNISIDFIEKF